MDPNRAVYVISVAAELAGVHPQTLRIYERKGLVSPARTGGGSRRYSDADISLLAKIQQLTEQGYNLVGVQRVMELEAEVAMLRAKIERLKIDASAAIADAHRQHRRDLVPLNEAVISYASRHWKPPAK